MARFTKGNGLGNDYLVMEEQDIDPAGPGRGPLDLPPQLGVSSDGILLRTASGVADVGLRIFNPDGSEAEVRQRPPDLRENISGSAAGSEVAHADRDEGRRGRRRCAISPRDAWTR